MPHKLFFTYNKQQNLDNHYIVGTGVGSKSRFVRSALKKRANNNSQGKPCCSHEFLQNKNNISMQNKNKLQLILYVQADDDTKSLYNVLTDVSKYRKQDPSSCYFDKIIIFAANIDYGQDASCSHKSDIRCWQKNIGCKPYSTLSLNSAITNLFCDKKNHSILKSLRNMGSQIYISILGNWEGGGLGGFTDMSGADYFVKSIDEVLQYYGVEHFIDGISFDDEFTDTTRRSTKSPPHSSYNYLKNALDNSNNNFTYHLATSWSFANNATSEDINILTNHKKLDFLTATNYYMGVSDISALIQNGNLTINKQKSVLGIQMINDISYGLLNDTISALGKNNMYGVALFTYKDNPDTKSFLDNPDTKQFLKQNFRMYKQIH